MGILFLKLELKEILRIVHFWSKLFFCTLLILFEVFLLPFFHFLQQVCCCGFIFVHETIPFTAKLLELCPLRLFSCLHFSLIKDAQVLISPQKFAFSYLFDLSLRVPGLRVTTVTFTLFAIVIEQSACIVMYLRKSMSLGSTVRQSAYFSSSADAACSLNA